MAAKIFNIPNDVGAPIGPAVYSAQASPDAIDLAILANGILGTGIISDNLIQTMVICNGTCTYTGSTVAVSSLVGAQTLSTTTATTHFPSAGTFWATTDGTSPAKITYTGKTASSFTGCTTVSGTGNILLSSTFTTLSTTVAGAFFAIQGTRYQTNIGLSTVLALADADTTYDRWDIVYTDSTLAVTIAQGTPAADPCFPPLSTDSNGWMTSLALAAIYVPANATSLTTANNVIPKAPIIRSPDFRMAVADAAVTGSTANAESMRHVAFTSISADRIVTLPAASDCHAGMTITVCDESGNCQGVSAGTSKQISIKPAGSDTVNGVLAATNFETIREPYGSVTFRSDGSTNWEIISVTPSCRREVFTSTAASGYRTPLTAKNVFVLAIGGGGAGGSGEKQVASTASSGGGGGQAGGVTEAFVNPTDLSATETVTVGAAGSAGGTRTSTGAGANGGAGGDSKFTIGGTVTIFAQGGAGGIGGTGGSGGSGGSANANSMWQGLSGGVGATGAAGGPAPATAGGNISVNAGNYFFGPSGGGGGGGCTTSAVQAAAAGGTGPGGTGTTGAVIAGGTAGGTGAVGQPGNASTSLSTNWFYGGTGGGGGGARTTAGNGQVGGAGAKYGGGGGGGGNGVGATNTNSNGNGGVGGAGVVVIWTWR